MQTYFTEVFTQRMPAEQLETCREVIALFETVGYTAPFEALQECIEIGTSWTDTAGFISHAREILEYGLDLLLKAFGIEVTESASMEFKLQFAQFVTSLEYYYLPQEILGLLEEPTDASDLLADIAYQVTGLPQETTLENLYQVERRLIDRIHEVMLAKCSELTIDELQATEPVVDPSRVLRIQVLNNLLRSTDTEDFSIVPELIEAGARIGTLDPVAIINQYVDNLTLIDTTKLAKELFSIVVFSYTPKESWLATTRELAGEFTDLLSDLRVVDRYLDSQKGLLNHA